MSNTRPRDSVITAAYGVGPDYVYPFLRTFRAVNQEARVILLASDPRRLAGIAEKFGAELRLNTWLARVVPTIKLESKRQRVRVSEVISRTNRVFPRLSRILPDWAVEVFVSLPVARLGHTRRVLASEPMGSVLVSDCRDVVFQADPFAEPLDLVFARESGVYGRCAFNDKWIRHGFGEETLRRFAGLPFYCSGTILGRRERVLEHIDRMWRLVRRLRTWRCFGQDQGIHNYVIHTQLAAGAYQISSNQEGLIATLGLEKEVQIRDNLLVGAAGDPFAILHQYDRLPREALAQLNCLRLEGLEKIAGF